MFLKLLPELSEVIEWPEKLNILGNYDALYVQYPATASSSLA